MLTPNRGQNQQLNPSKSSTKTLTSGLKSPGSAAQKNGTALSPPKSSSNVRSPASSNKFFSHSITNFRKKCA